jgi:hypothetical protein
VKQEYRTTRGQRVLLLWDPGEKYLRIRLGDELISTTAAGLIPRMELGKDAAGSLVEIKIYLGRTKVAKTT